MPVIRARGVAHAATIEAVDYMSDHAAEWVAASGGRGIRRLSIPITPQGSEHSAGTVRMGENPDLAACDARGLLFGTDNVYVADASLHPTNGGFNPALTVMANSLRIARLLLA
jgi:choline dehydrogenase-like flavoprotein